MKNKKHTVWLVLTIAVACVCAVAMLNMLGYHHVLATLLSVSSLVVAAVGVILVYRELEMTNDISEAEFISNINTTFVTNNDYKKVYVVLDEYQRLLSCGASRDVLREAEKEIEALDNSYISNYLTFFEVLNVLRKKGVLRLDTIDDLFAYRFFIAVRNRCVHRRKIAKGNFKNILELQNVWERYRRENGCAIYGEDILVGEVTFSRIGLPYLGEVLAIQQEAFDHMPDKQLLRPNTGSALSDCLENHYVKGAFCNGELIGFAVLYFAGDTDENLVRYVRPDVQDYSQYANVKLVIVRPAYRGRGLQRQLTERLEAEARKREICSLLATVSPLNTHSESNLLASGYVKAAYVERKYGDYDRNVFIKDLCDGGRGIACA